MVNMKVRRCWEFVTSGYNYQYMRNMLHVNNGNGTFREVGQLSKIHKTDWSWASLFMDMDNDGWQDLYITNGYFKDFSDKDYKNSYQYKYEFFTGSTYRRTITGFENDSLVTYEFNVAKIK